MDTKTSAALVLEAHPGRRGRKDEPRPGHHERYLPRDRVRLAASLGAGMFKGSVNVAGERFNAGGKDYDGLIVHLDEAGQVQWAKHMQPRHRLLPRRDD